MGILANIFVTPRKLWDQNLPLACVHTGCSSPLTKGGSVALSFFWFPSPSPSPPTSSTSISSLAHDPAHHSDLQKGGECKQEWRNPLLSDLLHLILFLPKSSLLVTRLPAWPPIILRGYLVWNWKWEKSSCTQRHPRKHVLSQIYFGQLSWHLGRGRAGSKSPFPGCPRSLRSFPQSGPICPILVFLCEVFESGRDISGDSFVQSQYLYPEGSLNILSAQQDGLCIFIWVFVIYLFLYPVNKEI